MLKKWKCPLWTFTVRRHGLSALDQHVFVYEFIRFMWSSTFLLGSNNLFQPACALLQINLSASITDCFKDRKSVKISFVSSDKKFTNFFGDFFEELNRIRPISCTSVFVTTRSSSQKKRQDLKYLIPASSEKIMKCWNSHLKKVKLVNMKVSYSVNIGHGHFWSILWHHGTVHWALLGVEI